MERQSSEDRSAGREPKFGNCRAVVATSLLSMAMGNADASMAAHAGRLDSLDGLRSGGHGVGIAVMRWSFGSTGSTRHGDIHEPAGGRRQSMWLGGVRV